MTDSKMKPRWAAVVIAILTLLSACQNPKAQLPNRANFTAALNDYLEQRGYLCLAKYDWPIAVTAADRQANNANAQQMFVLETLGLVKGHDVGSVTPQAREYALTAEGQKYYLHVPVVITTATQNVVHPADFCAATLSLDRVIGWEKPMTLNNRTATSVLFTYKIAPAPWTQTPEARGVFPVVTHAIENAGTLQLRLGVHLTPKGWVADELSE